MLVIDMKTHTVTNGKKTLIKNGKPQNGFQISTEPVSFSQLEELYQTYKHSVPDGLYHKRNYFKALPFEQLSEKDLIQGANREKSRETLEMALITGILNGSLVWPDDTKWFWQSSSDKDFILLKDWFVTGKEE